MTESWMIIWVFLYVYFGMSLLEFVVGGIAFPEFVFRHVEETPDFRSFAAIITKNEGFHHGEADTCQPWPLRIRPGTTAHRPE